VRKPVLLCLGALLCAYFLNSHSARRSASAPNFHSIEAAAAPPAPAVPAHESITRWLPKDAADPVASDSWSLDELWQDPQSPIHNGDRQRPVTVVPYPGRPVEFFVEKTMQTATGSWYSIGRTRNEGSAVVTTKVGEQTVFVLHDPVAGARWSVVPAAEGTQLVQGRSPCGGAIKPAALAARRHEQNFRMNVEHPRETFTDLTPRPSNGRISLAAFYSPALATVAAAWGGFDGLHAMIEAGVQLTNVALGRAGADTRVEFVGMTKLQWEEILEGDELVDASANLDAFVDAFDAAFKDKLNSLPADLVMGIPGGVPTDWGGVALLDPGRHFLVIPDDLATVTLGHEIGHTMGMAHNREDAKDIGGHKYGFRTRATHIPVHTVMAYPDNTDQAEVLTFSDPNFVFQGVALGDETTNNARVAREMAATIAGTVDGDYRFVGDAWLLNQSTRGYVGRDAEVMIAGMVVQGSGPKQIVIRGLGPSLQPHGVKDALSDPKITVYSGSNVVATNGNWKDGDRAAELKTAGLTPPNDLDAALVVTLNPGAYTVIVEGEESARGVALVEAFGLDRTRHRLVFADASAGPEWNRGPVRIDTWEHGTRNPFSYYLATEQPVDVMFLSVRPSHGMKVAVGAQSEWVWSDARPVSQHPKRELILATATRARDDSTVWFETVPAGKNVLAYLHGYLPWVNFQSGPLDAIEVYHFRPGQVQAIAPGNRFINLSTRGLIGRGDRALIGGIVVTGNSPKTYLFRALGEHLHQYGVTNHARNLTVEVHDAKQRLHRYESTRPEDIPALRVRKLLPDGKADIAGLVTLPPGQYTFVLSANADADVGVGMIEIYEP
jgi:hypothetical protein